ncbi:PREDICTED: uncharacterized protein LOC109176436 [Ipomoea nil]|uniref:uncharacterized protein LOC109176436 n=1 Tax=Ipomoea nil TaxID=35883 RepID=UPI000900FE41|nr:PREDICTED: uncharacterized protein LOC109176436 [Ipomoea nil]
MKERSSGTDSSLAFTSNWGKWLLLDLSGIQAVQGVYVKNFFHMNQPAREVCKGTCVIPHNETDDLNSVGAVRSVFGPFVELVKSWNLPDWIVHWGHPGNMSMQEGDPAWIGYIYAFAIFHSKRRGSLSAGIGCKRS